jgi:hypothetical protein
MPQEPRPKKLLDQMRDVLRTQHYAIRTENAYVDWAKRFILFHQKRHPTEMGWVEIEAFLTRLAVDRHIAAPTQNQALSALLFLYKESSARRWGRWMRSARGSPNASPWS